MASGSSKRSRDMFESAPSNQPGSVPTSPPQQWGYPSAPPRWAVLQRVRCIMDDDDLSGPDFSLALVPPPRLSQLKVRPNIASDRVTKEGFLSTLAADHSGILLVASTNGALPADKPTAAYVKTLFACDVLAGTVVRLPDRDDPAICPANTGLIVDAGAADHRNYMVVELLPLPPRGDATLIFFSSDFHASKWEKRSTKYPLKAFPWYNSGVFSYERSLWWVDLSRGLLTYDVFAAEPKLQLVELPLGTELPGVPSGGDLHKHRCITVSGGKISFVMMTRYGEPKVSVYTLVDLESSEWKLERQVAFQSIWVDQSYKMTGLPDKEQRPVLAFLHPENPDVVYFFVHKHLISVDLSSIKINSHVASNPVPQPINAEASSCFILPWLLPPTLNAASDPDEEAKRTSFHSIRERLKAEHHKLIETQKVKKLVSDALSGKYNPHSGEGGQTTVCARKALKDYNLKNGTSYVLTVAEDSHAFDLTEDKGHEHHFFVHVNFTATNQRNGQTDNFFAELKGDHEPQETTVVEILGPNAEDICVYCTGLLHPTSVAFQGIINVGR